MSVRELLTTAFASLGFTIHFVILASIDTLKSSTQL